MTKLTTFVNKMNSRMSILSHVMVRDGVACTTSLKEWAWQPLPGTPDGLYPFGSLQKGYRIPSNQSMDDWPKPPKEPETWAPLSTDQAWAILDAFSCISDDETRYYMNGVCITRDGFAVGTDGRRLHIEKIGVVPELMIEGKDLIIPEKETLKAMLTPDRSRPPLEVGRTETQFWARRGDHVVAVETIVGQYPLWERCVPADEEFGDNWADLPSEEALGMAMYLAPKSKRIYFQPDGTVETEDGDGDGKRIRLDTVATTFGKTLCINANFLLTAKKMGATRIFVLTRDNESLTARHYMQATRMKLVTGGLQIVMPMQAD